MINQSELEWFETHSGQRVKIIETVSNQWHELARELGFAIEDIHYIEDAFPHDHDASCEMFSRWLDEELELPVTWTTLSQCLINTGFVELADIIKESLN